MITRKALAQHLSIAHKYKIEGQQFQSALWLGMAIGAASEAANTPDALISTKSTNEKVRAIASYFYNANNRPR